MIEALLPMVMEKAMEAAMSVKDIMPKFFEDIPSSRAIENVDAPVSPKEVAGGEGAEHSDRTILITRNESLEGEVHPDTGVAFERRVIGEPYNIEGVFPEFESRFDAQIPQDQYGESDRTQFAECNAQLREAVRDDKELAKVFDKNQLEQIENGDAPDGYVWHHDADPGKIQLVDFESHAKTGHTGGRYVWGGGNDNR